VKKYCRFAGAVLAVVISLAVCACGGDTGEDKDGAKSVSFPDSVVDEDLLVTVNGQAIRGRELRLYTEVYGAGTRDSLRSPSFNIKILDGLIDRTLLLIEAQAIGTVIDDSTRQWYMREFTRAMGGDARIDQFLTESGFTRYDFESLIKQDLLIRKFIETRVSPNLVVPDSVAIAYYQENSSQFVTPDSVRARHIIIRASQGDTPSDIENKKQTLRDLRDRARAGDDFAALAKEYSEGPSASAGGDLGYFTQRDMVAPFSTVAFALKPGEVSDVVVTQFGYHVLQVVDIKKSRKVEYAEIEEELKVQIGQFMMAQNLQNHLQRGRTVAIIEKNY